LASKGMVVLLAACVSIALLLTPTVTCAQPRYYPASGSNGIKKISSEIRSSDQQLEAATEDCERVRLDLKAMTARVYETQDRLSRLKQSLSSQRALLDKCAILNYEGEPVLQLQKLFSTADLFGFFERLSHVLRKGRGVAVLVARIKQTRGSIEAVKKELCEQERQREVMLEQALHMKSEAEADLADSQDLVDSLNGTIRESLAQKQAVLAGEQVLNQEAKDMFASVPNDNLGDEVAKAALGFLGAPYAWHADGPEAFCCSGFTMYVYGLLGVDLPDVVNAQSSLGIKIPLDQARPGDLVFFGRLPVHVGIYLADDLFIEAPHAGDVVKVSRLSDRSDFSMVRRYWR